MEFLSKPRRVAYAAARQRGYSVLEVTLAISLIAAIGVVVFLAFGDTQSSVNQTRALSEINALASSARQYRSTFAQGGLYTNVNMEALEGYNLAGMDVTGTGATSSGTNAYGLGVTIESVATNADAEIEYTTPSQDVCEDLMPLFTNAAAGTTASTATNEHAPGFKAGVVCSAAGALTLIVE